MREIKFRAWDKEKDAWFPFDHLEMLAIFNLHDSHFENNGNRATPNLIFSQFTGLHDKNGKEIYEGDILATSNNDSEYDIWGKEDNGYTAVIWDNKYSCFKGTKWTWARDVDDSIYALMFIEVIGNIYENPELLEAK